jgi:hypothetical protein
VAAAVNTVKRDMYKCGSAVSWAWDIADGTASLTHRTPYVLTNVENFTYYGGICRLCLPLDPSATCSQSGKIRSVLPSAL